MSLSEVLISALLLALAGAQSLGVWASALGWSQQQQRRAELLLRLDGELQLLQARLRRAGVAEGASADCQAALERMVPLLASPAPAAAPLVPDLQRQVHWELEGLRLTVRSAALGLERQRWWSPRVYGLCGPEAVEVAAGGQP